MKKILFCLALFAACFSGCSKSDKKSTETPAMDFTINGVSDVTYKFEKVTMAISLGLVSGPQETVNLSLTGLPEGMKGTFGSVSGTPTFATTLEFTHSGKTTAGTYPLKVVATTASGKAKSVGMNLTVTVVDNCGQSLAGNYYGADSDGFTYSKAGFIVKASYPNRLYYTNDGVETGIYYDLNCSDQTLTAPSSGGFTYTGKFTLSPKSIEITQTDVGGNKTVFTFTPR